MAWNDSPGARCHQTCDGNHMGSMPCGPGRVIRKLVPPSGGGTYSSVAWLARASSPAMYRPSPVPCSEVDGETRITLANEAALLLLGEMGPGPERSLAAAAPEL